jgi:hypothetical protein
VLRLAARLQWALFKASASVCWWLMLCALRPSHNVIARSVVPHRRGSVHRYYREAVCVSTHPCTWPNSELGCVPVCTLFPVPRPFSRVVLIPVMSPISLKPFSSLVFLSFVWTRICTLQTRARLLVVVRVCCFVMTPYNHARRRISRCRHGSVKQR